MNNRRDERYDFYKGCLMIGVVLGHVLTALQAGYGSTFWIHEFVRTYDMPMFAFISGIFLKKSCEKREPIKNILNKVGGILLPALIWSEIFALIGGRLIPSTGGLWFLYATFASSVIVIMVDKIRSIPCQIIGFILVIVLLHTIVIDPFNTGFLLPAVVVGYYYNSISSYLRNNLNTKKQTVIGCIMVLLFVVCQCFWKLDYNVWNLGCNVLNNEAILSNVCGMVFRFSIGILGSIVMMWVFNVLYKWLSGEENIIFDRIISRIIIWGESTLELYILHAWVVSVGIAKIMTIVVQKLGYNPLMRNERFLLLIIAPFTTIIVLYSLHFVSTVIRRIPIIGRYAFSIKFPAREVNAKRKV